MQVSVDQDGYSENLMALPNNYSSKYLSSLHAMALLYDLLNNVVSHSTCFFIF